MVDRRGNAAPKASVRQVLSNNKRGLKSRFVPNDHTRSADFIQSSRLGPRADWIAAVRACSAGVRNCGTPAWP